MFVEDIIDACTKIINGDTEALRRLGLDTISYPQPKPLNISPMNIRVTYNSVLNTAVAARELQLGFLQKQCEETLEALKAIAVATNMNLQHNLNGADVAEVMLALIDDERKRLFTVCPRPENNSDDDVVQLQPPPAAAAKKAPAPPAEGVLWMQPPPPAAQTAPQSPARDEVVVIQPQSANDAANVTSENRDNSQNLSEQSETSSTVAEQPGTTPAHTSYATASSKNKRRQCSLCPFFGTHLQCHIAAKHPDSFTSKPEKVALVHRYDKLSRQQQGKKEVQQYQCTYK